MTETVELLERLVGFDSTSRNANLDLVTWIESYLAGHGVSSVRIPDRTGTKAGLVARIGPAVAGGVVLCGHLDTVPVEGQPWTVDPFCLTEQRGWLYGRGTTDMKGFIAAALAAVPKYASAALARPVVLALSCDEEIGCLGAQALADHLVRHEQHPAVVVTGEPTSMQIAQAHKGVRVLRTTVTGRDAHSSRPDLGTSAVMAAARIVSHIESVAARLATAGFRDERYQPPYTSMNVGVFEGGQALNIIPRTATLLWEYRAPAGEDVEAVQAVVLDYAENELLPKLRVLAPEASIETEVLADVPPLNPDENVDAAALLVSLGVPLAAQALAYGTDGSTLQRAGLPTIVCGPGSMDQGHQPDEYIEARQLDWCDAVLSALAHWAEQPA